MNPPLNFPVEYGKLGNWPGTINPVQAQVIYSFAARLPKEANIIELGFDGGRTTIVLTWAAREISAIIDVLDVKQGAMRFWFNRVASLFGRTPIRAHEEVVPLFTAHMIVLNAGVSIESASRWIRALRPGGFVVKIGQAGTPAGLDLIELANVNGQVIAWQKNDTANIVNRAIDNVVGEMSQGGAVEPLDKDRGSKVRSLRGDKERKGNRDGTDSVLDARLARGQGD